MHFLASVLLAASLFRAVVPLLPQKREAGIPPAWKFVRLLSSPKDRQEALEFTLVLKSADQSGLTRRMTEIAEQGDGRWLTLAELKAYASPTVDTKSAVLRYLGDQGFQPSQFSFNDIGDHLTVKSTVHEAARLFNASFAAYRLRDLPPVPRTLRYTMPVELAAHVDHVFPITSFMNVRAKIGVTKSFSQTPARNDTKLQRSNAEVSSRCDAKKITPTCLRRFYGADSFTPVPGSASLGILGALGLYYDPKSLFEFLSIYQPEIADSYQVQVENVFKDIPNDPRSPGDEAALDLEVAVPQIIPLKTTFLSVGNDSFPDDPFMAAFDYLISKEDRPDVFSMSYGGEEIPGISDLVTTTCKKVQQLTSLGVTVVCDTGDYGVTGPSSDLESCPPFRPDYPSTCPFILAVGATAIDKSGGETMVKYDAAHGIYSGSSRSLYFPIPSYQVKALESYQKKIGRKSEGLYNTSGRSIPDVVACGQGHATVVNGSERIIGGVSASAPLVASLMTLLVSARNSTGKGPLGWANPALYKHPEIFKDIVDGGSYCVNGAEDPPGFPATVGFDSASGLGSPRLQALIKALG